MNRRQLREEIFKILFSIEFHPPEELDEQIRLALEDQENIREEDADYIRDKVKKIAGVCTEIDAAVNEAAEKWKTSRMGKAELTIIRLAVYEMKYDPDVDTPVAINEAVELAKIYGGEESSRFVNGILARLA